MGYRVDNRKLVTDELEAANVKRYSSATSPCDRLQSFRPNCDWTGCGPEHECWLAAASSEMSISRTDR